MQSGESLQGVEGKKIWTKAIGDVALIVFCSCGFHLFKIILREKNMGQLLS